MHEMLVEFFSQKEREQMESAKNAEAKKQKRRQEYLISLGLYEKEYAQNEQQRGSEAFLNFDEQGRQYRKTAIEVTDDEYAEICKYTKPDKEEDMPEGAGGQPRNKVSVALKAIAWTIFIIGFIAGMVLGFQPVLQDAYGAYNEAAFSFSAAFSCWWSAFLSGMGFFFLGELLKLLQDIANKKC